jgi:Protein of unknown function (DUF1194)
MRNTCRYLWLKKVSVSVDKVGRSLASESKERRLRSAGLRVLGAWLAVAIATYGLRVAEATAQVRVDVELVIAVDVSLSMDMDEQRLQREGYVAAFRDAELHRAITSGAYGRIAVAYMEWAGPSWQSIIIPWTVIDGPEAARRFADLLAGQPISRHRLTSIGGALQFAQSMFASSGVAGVRRVVDISGDGPNNAGLPAAVARDALVADGMVVNGLPIMLKTGSPSFFDLSDLDRYYAACVIGGAGAFMVPVKDIAELKSAIRRKLLLEISGLDAPQLIPAQNIGPETYDCLIGERQWRWYLDGGPN